MDLGQINISRNGKVSGNGIPNCIKRLSWLKQEITNEMNVVLRTVAQIMCEEARARYAQSADKNNPVPSVQYMAVQSGKGVNPTALKIVAKGKSVCFLEFGAGTMADQQHPYAIKVSFPVGYATFSESVGTQMLANNGYWEYGGQIYETKNGVEYAHIYPSRALWKASERGKKELRDIIQNHT